MSFFCSRERPPKRGVIDEVDCPTAVDIGIISRQLGHASITITARYLDHIVPRAVIEAMRRRSWTGA